MKYRIEKIKFYSFLIMLLFFFSYFTKYAFGG